MKEAREKNKVVDLRWVRGKTTERKWALSRFGKWMRFSPDRKKNKAV